MFARRRNVHRAWASEDGPRYLRYAFGVQGGGAHRRRKTRLRRAASRKLDSSRTDGFFRRTRIWALSVNAVHPSQNVTRCPTADSGSRAAPRRSPRLLLVSFQNEIAHIADRSIPYSLINTVRRGIRQVSEQAAKRVAF